MSYVRRFMHVEHVRVILFHLIVMCMVMVSNCAARRPSVIDSFSDASLSLLGPTVSDNFIQRKTALFKYASHDDFPRYYRLK